MKRKFLIYLSVFLSGSLAVTSCGTASGSSKAHEAASKKSPVVSDFREEQLQIVRDDQVWRDAVRYATAVVEHAKREAAEAARREREARDAREARAVAIVAARAARSNTAAPAITYEPGTIQDMICSAFGAACQKALRVAKCESGFDPRATNGQFRGLFQIGTRIHSERIASHRDGPSEEFPEGRAWTADDMYDPHKNIVIALELSNGGRTWGPWECQ